MTVRRIAVAGVAFIVAAGFSACSARNAWVAPPAQAQARLTPFSSCDVALAELKAAASKHVGPYGFDNPNRRYAQDQAVPAPDAQREGSAKEVAPVAPSEGHSGTNNQEANVDEPDLVKTDGRRIVSLSGGKLRVIDVARRVETGKVAIPGHSTSLMLQGDRAFVILPAMNVYPGVPEPSGPTRVAPDEPYPGPTTQRSRVIAVDLVGTPKIAETFQIDGEYVDARVTDGVARLVVRSGPRLQWRANDNPDQPVGAAIKGNREVIAKSRIDDWLPAYEVSGGGHTETGRVACDAVSRPARYTGESMLTVLTFDLARPLDSGAPVSVVADGDTVYSDGATLYVASQQMRAGGGTGTELYEFDTAGRERPRHTGSGWVPGSVLNQYSMSRQNGVLRIATTEARGGKSVSGVHLLSRKGDRLTEIGAVGGLGKGERIYAVRFVGTQGYVVTFRQVDPLYVLDLADPTKPRALGELKINGYSAYLHPVGDGRLIGVGADATDQGQRTGSSVSLFDVRDPANPRRVAQHVLDGGSSTVEFDPHAFLYWPARQLLAVPVQSGNGSGLLILTVGDGQLPQRGMIKHPTADGRAVAGTGPMIQRSLVIGDTLWSISGAGVMAHDLATLKQTAWLAFR